MSTYKVVGNHTVEGVEPGKTVKIDDEARARRLVRAGHLEPVKAKKATKKKAN